MRATPRLRNFLFQLRYGFKGVPFQIGGHTIRLDESLRRWHAGSEFQVQQILLANLHRGECMVDVGANFGLHSLLAGMIVGSSGEVHAFEPLPSNVEKLRRNVRLNQLESVVRIIPSAISDSPDSEVTFFSGANEIDVTASLVKSVDDTEELKVANTRLDDYMPLIRGPVRLLKIDVEGAELRVLRSAQELLKVHKPILVIEVHAFAFPDFFTSLEEFKRFLSDFGYDEEILPETSLRNGLHYQAVYRDRNHKLLP
jgi:FkbM family methyltransferase